MERKKRSAEKGFTLIEVIMAVTILAMIVGIITAGLRLSSVTIDRGEETAREAARLRAAIRVIERSIRSADPLPVSVGDKPSLFFIGENDHLLFLTAQSAAAFGFSGSQLISFYEVPGPGGGLAVFMASPFQAGEGIRDEVDEARILVHGAEGLAFSYSSGPDEYGSWDWLPLWDSKNGLPMAVRVEFIIHTVDGPRKTTFVVPIMVVAGATT